MFQKGVLYAGWPMPRLTEMLKPLPVRSNENRLLVAFVTRHC